MPRFAANLSMMFTEHAFPARFQAAADAGFDAVEFLFPYAHPAQGVADWCRRAGVEQVLFNLSPGDWEAGDRGLAALPGRKEEFRQSLRRALDYAAIIGTTRLHMMAGIADHVRSGASGLLPGATCPCRRCSGGTGRDDHDRADQRARHAGLFSR
jgi:hydroxypyruvate isomerase